VQSTGHDRNLAALQAGAGLPGHVLDIVVLTVDPSLLATLREASGLEHALWHAAAADMAVDYLVGGRCNILIADLGALRGDAAALLEQLHAQFPELILLATGRRDEEHTVSTLVSDGRIYRFLHKPVSPARASTFLATAARRYHELRNVPTPAPDMMTTGKMLAVKTSRSPRIAATIVVLLAAAVMAVFWMVYIRSDADAPAPVRSSGPTKEERIADQLGRAEIAYAAGRLIEPRGHNALEYFRAVLALQPEHAQAKVGIERIAMALETELIEALQARDAPRGAVLIKALQNVQPDNPRLDALTEQLFSISRNVKVLPPQDDDSSKPSSSR
jgi:DNA-binding NarL/FixJ family response regulator